VLEGEVADLFGLKVEDADDLVFDDERDGKFGADGGVGVDVVFGVVTSSTRRDLRWRAA
jgi:hypothetical protein